MDTSTAENEEVRALFNEVDAAGGRLSIPTDHAAENRYRLLAEASLSDPNRPVGRRLELRAIGPWWERRQLEMVYVDHFDDLIKASPIPVPDGRIFHPAVQAFVASRDWQWVTKPHVPRASLILEAIVGEALRRGFEVFSTEQSAMTFEDRNVRTRQRRHLTFVALSSRYEIQIREIPGLNVTRLAHGSRRSSPQWIESRGWEFVSTGKLEIVVKGPGLAYDGTRYRDKARSEVEDHLPEIFRQIEIERLRADARATAAARAAAVKMAQWEVAVSKAIIDFEASRRLQHFDDAHATWR